MINYSKFKIIEHKEINSYGEVNNIFYTIKFYKIYLIPLFNTWELYRIRGHRWSNTRLRIPIRFKSKQEAIKQAKFICKSKIIKTNISEELYDFYIKFKKDE